jgi:hypothetical protein
MNHKKTDPHAPLSPEILSPSESSAVNIMRYCLVLLEKEEHEVRRRREQLEEVLTQYQQGNTIRFTPSREELSLVKKAKPVNATLGPPIPALGYELPKNGKLGGVFPIRARVNNALYAVLTVLAQQRGAVRTGEIADSAEQQGLMQQHGHATIKELVISCLSSNRKYFHTPRRGFWMMTPEGKHMLRQMEAAA